MHVHHIILSKQSRGPALNPYVGIHAWVLTQEGHCLINRVTTFWINFRSVNPNIGPAVAGSAGLVPPPLLQ